MRPRRIGKLAVACVAIGAAITLAAASWQEIETRRDRRRFPPTGKMIQIGAGKIHLNCIGTATPAVVVSGGTGVLSSQWSKIQRDLAKDARVCTSDRPGFAWSTPAPGPRTAAQSAEDLYAALRAAGERGPYLLVGESIWRLCGAAVPESART